jgi:hypothetical protein
MSRSRTLRSRVGALTLLGSLQLGQVARAEDVAPKDAELAPARALFGEALQDELEGRLAMALEKFRRVRDVRDTAAIEYRIGLCEEGLGRLVAAGASYGSAIRLGEGDTPTQAVTAAARERLASLQQRIGHLTLNTPVQAPTDEEIMVDGTVPTSLREIPLDPGPHVITARATGRVPFRSEITLLEGGTQTVSIPLPPASGAPRMAAGEAPHGRGARTAGWVAVVAGGALLASSGIVLLVRQSEIGSLRSACPGSDNECPSTADESSLEATRSRALLEGPLGVGLAVAGSIAAGVGLYLLLRPSSQTSRSTSVALFPTGAALGGTF